MGHATPFLDQRYFMVVAFTDTTDPDLIHPIYLVTDQVLERSLDIGPACMSKIHNFWKTCSVSDHRVIGFLSRSVFDDVQQRLLSRDPPCDSSALIVPFTWIGPSKGTKVIPIIIHNLITGPYKVPIMAIKPGPLESRRGSKNNQIHGLKKKKKKKELLIVIFRLLGS